MSFSGYGFNDGPKGGWIEGDKELHAVRWVSQEGVDSSLKFIKLCTPDRVYRSRQEAKTTHSSFTSGTAIHDRGPQGICLKCTQLVKDIKWA